MAGDEIVKGIFWLGMIWLGIWSGDELVGDDIEGLILQGELAWDEIDENPTKAPSLKTHCSVALS